MRKRWAVALAVLQCELVEATEHTTLEVLQGQQVAGLEMVLDGKSERVLLRSFQMHPYKPQVLHIDFQRISADEQIRMNVPLHFVGEEKSPAVTVDKTNVNHALTELLVSCLPDQLPEFITVDLSGLTVDKPVHVSDLVLPEGVTAVLKPEEDPTVASAVVVAEESIADEAPAVPALPGAQRPSDDQLSALDAGLPEQPLHVAAILTGKLQCICAQSSVAVRDNFAEQLKCIFAFSAVGLFQKRLPLLRHLVEEAGVFNCTRLFAEHGHILRPVVDLIIGFVAPAIVPNRVVVMKKLHMVIENLGLHRFAGQHGVRADRQAG